LYAIGGLYIIMAQKFKLSEKKEESYIIIGLVSHDESYQLCLDLNTQLSIKFSLTGSINYQDNTYSHFSYTDSTGVSYHVVGNKIGHNYLAGNFKNIDYFFILKGPLDIIKTDIMVQQIRKCQTVQATLTIPLDQMKKADFLKNL
jgi:hypothetical protein